MEGLRSLSSLHWLPAVRPCRSCGVWGHHHLELPCSRILPPQFSTVPHLEAYCRETPALRHWLTYRAHFTFYVFSVAVCAVLCRPLCWELFSRLSSPTPQWAVHLTELLAGTPFIFSLTVTNLSKLCNQNHYTDTPTIIWLKHKALKYTFFYLRFEYQKPYSYCKCNVPNYILSVQKCLISYSSKCSTVFYGHVIYVVCGFMIEWKWKKWLCSRKVHKTKKCLIKAYLTFIRLNNNPLEIYQIFKLIKNETFPKSEGSQKKFHRSCETELEIWDIASVI